MAYDIENNSWSHLKPSGTAPASANTNAAFYDYDARRDIVVAIHFSTSRERLPVFMRTTRIQILGQTRFPFRQKVPHFILLPIPFSTES
jgi:hypothetical protein